jgi:hypothetical protein
VKLERVAHEKGASGVHALLRILYRMGDEATMKGEVGVRAARGVGMCAAPVRPVRIGDTEMSKTANPERSRLALSAAAPTLR